MIAFDATDFLPGSEDEASVGLLRLIQGITSHLVVGVIALIVIGGSTRVMEAGLACPDWPLCYGSLLPGKQMNLQVFLEWFHRVDAFLIGLALLALNFIVALRRSSLPPWLPWCTLTALILVAIQAALGAITVTSLLASNSVTAHLGTALVLLLHLCATDQALRCKCKILDPGSFSLDLPPRLPRWWWPLPLTATLALLAQCLVGALMASQWAAESCLDLGESCYWLLNHRLMAYPVLFGFVLMAIGATFLPSSHRMMKSFSFLSIAFGLGQILIGRFNLIVHLDIPLLTISHQLIAALLVAMLGAAIGRTLLMTTSSWPVQEVVDFG
jgi:cytochrome c oxidase assembly protein subunit 15